MNKLVFVVVVVSAWWSFSAKANDGEALVKKNGCMACHALQSKMVGPAFKDIAVKYQGDANAVAVLSSKVLNGSAGVWGQLPMPPHKGRVTDDQVKAMINYVLSIQ